MTTTRRPAGPGDLERVLKHNARQMVDELEENGEPVDPTQVASRIVFAHSDSPEVAARAEELRIELEDYVRELRASNTQSE